MAASLTRIPGDTYNEHFNECYFYSAGCWLHSVWSPLALKVQVDVRASRIYSQTGGNYPLLTTHRPSSRSPDLVRLKAGNPAPIKAGSAEAAKRVFTLQRGGREEERESRQCVSCDLHPNLQFEKSSTLQGGVTVKCFQFVLCGNCFLPRLTSATCEQFEKSGLCSFQDSYVLYTREEAFLLSWESALVKLNQASQWDSTKSNLDTDMHLVTLRIDLSVTTCHALISGQ